MRAIPFVRVTNILASVIEMGCLVIATCPAIAGAAVKPGSRQAATSRQTIRQNRRYKIAGEVEEKRRFTAGFRLGGECNEGRMSRSQGPPLLRNRRPFHQRSHGIRLHASAIAAGCQPCGLFSRAPSGWRDWRGLCLGWNFGESLLTLFCSRLPFRLISCGWRVGGLFEHTHVSPTSKPARLNLLDVRGGRLWNKESVCGS